MSTPTLAPLFNPGTLAALRPRNDLPAAPSAGDRPSVGDPQHPAAGPAPLQLNATTYRDDTVLSQRQLDYGGDHLALHLFTTRALDTAQRLRVTDGKVVVDLASSVAAQYSVDLSIDVSFLSDLAGQMDRLAGLDPALLHDFATAFQSLDGSRSAQKAFFHATDTLFDGLENDLGLSATELDDEAAVVKQGVQDFFRQVQRYDRMLSKAAAGAENQVGQALHRIAADTLHAVEQSDAVPVRRQQGVQDLLARIGDHVLDRPTRNHLGHLFKKLLHGAAHGREGRHGAWRDGGSDAESVLERAATDMGKSAAPAALLRGPIQELDDAIIRAEPLTATVSTELATRFVAQVAAAVAAVSMAAVTDAPAAAGAESSSNPATPTSDDASSAPPTLAAWNALAAATDGAAG